VYLVGAGPGDPGLLTVAAAGLLASAGVVLHDALVSEAVLAAIGAQATVCPVGKRGGETSAGQPEIEARLVAEARAGRSVVRLKGGDPFVFGRGGEEAQACAAAGIPFVVVPGISSALAGPAYAGIPVTHRGLARSFAMVTGTTDSDGDSDLASVAAVDTLVVLMAARKLEEVAAAISAAGRSPETPAAVIESATTPSQRLVRGTLGTIASMAAGAGIRPPALLVVGEVVDLAGSLGWFQPGPLASVRVAVTMTEARAGGQVAAFQAAGASVQAIPAVTITFPGAEQLAARLQQGWDWLVLPSRNAVSALAQAIRHTGRDWRVLGSARLAVAGPGTAEELAGYGMLPDFAPASPGAAGIGAALPLAPDDRVLLVQSDIAPSDLQVALEARGAQVTRIEAYHTGRRDLPVDEIAWLAGADAITFASPSAVLGVHTALSGSGKPLPANTRMVAIGPTTAAAVNEAFGRCDGIAATPDPEALVAAVVEAMA
jgi:uroporphyrinogen III methyltransferase/synthase